jgi:predicted phosphodiesterase
MAIYVTGDTHGDVSRLIQGEWLTSHIVSKGDVVFILGDFGVIFDNVPTSIEKNTLAKMAKKDYIFMVVCGNHENHPRLYNLPKTELFGGNVGVIKKDKIFHCRRGEIYTIEDKKFFTFGGATSIDRHLRIPGVSWWKEEVPSPAEMDYGLSNLEKHQYAVDYILAHTAPEDISKILIKQFNSFYNDPDPTRKYLEHVCKCCSFTGFYCGHWHVQADIDKYHFLYEDIRQIL